jgi:hypothetical protein
MSNTVFSISLDALHLAKVQEIMKKFPNESRNAVIKRCIAHLHIQRDLQYEYEAVVERYREASRRVAQLNKELDRL